MKKRVQVFAIGSLIFWTAFFAGGTSQAKIIVGLSSVNVAFLPGSEAHVVVLVNRAFTTQVWLP